MYSLVITNYEDLKNFGKNITFVKENQKYLDFNPILDGEEKIKKSTFANALLRRSRFASTGKAGY